MLHNKFRYASRKQTNEPGDLHEHIGESIASYYKKKDGDILDIEVEQEMREACIDFKKDIYAPIILEEEDAIVERNRILLHATEHVKEAQGMRRGKKATREFKKHWMIMKIIYHTKKGVV